MTPLILSLNFTYDASRIEPWYFNYNSWQLSPICASDTNRLPSSLEYTFKLQEQLWACGVVGYKQDLHNRDIRNYCVVYLGCIGVLLLNYEHHQISCETALCRHEMHFYRGVQLLEASFPYIKLPELRAIPLEVLGKLNPVPAAILKQISDDAELFDTLPTSVQHQARRPGHGLRFGFYKDHDVGRLFLIPFLKCQRLETQSACLQWAECGMCQDYF